MAYRLCEVPFGAGPQVEWNEKRALLNVMTATHPSTGFDQHYRVDRQHSSCRECEQQERISRQNVVPGYGTALGGVSLGRRGLVAVEHHSECAVAEERLRGLHVRGGPTRRRRSRRVR